MYVIVAALTIVRIRHNVLLLMFVSPLNLGTPPIRLKISMPKNMKIQKATQYIVNRKLQTLR